MTAPRRLRDDATGVERAVLDSARADDPSPEHQRRLIAAATTVTATAMTATAKAAVVWKIVIGLASISVVAVGYQHATNDPVVTTTEPTPPPIAHSAVALPPVPSVMTASAPPASVAPSTSAVAAKPVVASASVSAEPVSIAQEIALLDEARAGLAAGDGAKARTALDRYDAECPGGALAIEASVLRIETVALGGDKEPAAKLARRFLDAHPSSPHAPRVRKFLPSP